MRFGEHKHNILKERGRHFIHRHFQKYHEKDPLGLKLFGIEAIMGDPDSGRPEAL